MTWDMAELVKLGNDLEKSGPRVKAAVADKVETSARRITAAARAAAPVGKTGDLKDSVDYRILDSGVTGGAGLAAEVFAGMFYGLFVEYGTARGVAPQPFINPAADAEQTPFYNSVQAAVADRMLE